MLANIVFLGFGTIFGYVICYFLIRSKFVAKSYLDDRERELKNILNQLSITSEKLFNKDNEITKLDSLLEKQRQLDLEKQNHIVSLQSHLNSLQKNIDELEVRKSDLQKNFEEKKSEVLIQNSKIDELNSSLMKLEKSSSSLQIENQFLAQKLETQKTEISELQKTSRQEFENIANKILEEKSQKFTSANSENIQKILEPLNKDIEAFRKRVEESYEKESKERFSLENTIKNLQEHTNKISHEANNLASALKGEVKTQGNWGEMILETILQQSGLQKDLHYFKEKSFTDDEGKNLRPDFQIHLPDNRLIIADSKVSLIAYDKFCASKNREEQEIFLFDHIKSIKAHIDNLSAKKYDDLEKSLDFTMMFIPIEPAYLLAIQNDQQLWSYAYERRILLVSPTNFIVCLKIIADLWKRELQSKNAMEIVSRGEKLYEKFVGFTESLEKIGKHILESQKAYESSLNQLRSGRGNLTDQAIKLKNLGLKSNKKISEQFLPDELLDEEINSENS